MRARRPELLAAGFGALPKTLLMTLLAVLIGVCLWGVPAAAVDFPDDSGFTSEQRREIEEAVASSSDPLDVRILTELPRRAYGSANEAAYRIREASTNFRTQVVVWGGPDALPAFGVAGHGESYCAVLAVRDSRFDEHQQFVELVRLVADGTACQAMDEALAQRFRDRSESSSGGVVDEPADTTTWLIRGLVIIAGVLLIGAVLFFRGRSVHDAWRRKRRGEALTGFARDAAHRSAAERAHTDLLAFGEELDATEMRPDHRMSLWQRALDEYDEACRLHDRGTGDRRVIELCASGRRHLAEAIGTRAL